MFFRGVSVFIVIASFNYTSRLQTIDEGGSKSYDLHFWLGSETSQVRDCFFFLYICCYKNKLVVLVPLSPGMAWEIKALWKVQVHITQKEEVIT